MAGNTNKIGNLEDEAVKRRERLKALKRKREGKPEDDAADNNSTSLALPKPVFRSYKPADEKLNELSLPNINPSDVTTEIKDQLESAKSNMVIDQLDVTSLAPRKPDWDLKRDVEKKLQKLERQTQRAIGELIRERLKEHNENLAEMVNAGAPE